MSYGLLRSTFPLARTKHKCIWCGEPIEAGTKYRREQSVFDGEFQNHAWHLECDKDAQEYFSQGEETFQPYDNERPKVCA